MDGRIARVALTDMSGTGHDVELPRGGLVPVLEVDYEETVADLEGVARRLVSWCGLDWEPACLAFHEGKRPVRTASVTQVRQPIYSRSVARWKHYEPTLGPLFTKLATP